MLQALSSYFKIKYLKGGVSCVTKAEGRMEYLLWPRISSQPSQKRSSCLRAVSGNSKLLDISYSVNFDYEYPTISTSESHPFVHIKCCLLPIKCSWDQLHTNSLTSSWEDLITIAVNLSCAWPFLVCFWLILPQMGSSTRVLVQFCLIIFWSQP